MENNGLILDKIQHKIIASLKLTFPRSIEKSFVLDVDFEAPSEGVTAIFGESGSGKTSLLRCIAGLDKADSGKLMVNGKVWQDTSQYLPAHKRSIGYVFQEPSLLEHLTVMGNLSYAVKRSVKKTDEHLFTQVVEVMGIHDLLNQSTKQLSGGEKQRVAIARALLAQPKLLLMDEPLASLDSKRKLEILPYIEKLRQYFEIPIFYVTHSIDEIVRLADRVLVIQNGRIKNQGKVCEIFSNVEFPLGSIDDMGSVLECEIVETDEQWHLMKVKFDKLELWLPKLKKDNETNRCRIRILASDVSIILNPTSGSSILNQLEAEVIEIKAELEGATSVVKVKVGKSILLVRVTNKSISELTLSTTKNVWIQVKSAAIVR